MPHRILHPICVSPDTIVDTIHQQGYAVLNAAAVRQLANVNGKNLAEIANSWEGLPPDNHLKDGGRYRRRRHASYALSADKIILVPHRSHWQSLEYNALHGGMLRHFEPVLPATIRQPAWRQLLVMLSTLTDALFGAQTWFTEVHQFRIDTTDGIGRPTPEGAHRDGVTLVAVFFVDRRNVKGGETRIFQAESPTGLRFTLTEPWSLMLLDDRRVIHESTPIQPISGEMGYRDTLVVTLRAQGFQGDAAA